MEAKPEVVERKPESDEESGPGVKQENVFSKSSAKQAGDDSEKPSASQLNGAVRTLGEDAQVNGVVNGSLGESPEKENVAKTEDSEEQNGEKTKAEEESGDSQPEEEAEGRQSTF